MKEIRPIGAILNDVIDSLRELQARMNSDEVLTCKGAANYAGVSIQTISRYIRAGKLHKVCSKGVTGIRKAELDVVFG